MRLAIQLVLLASIASALAAQSVGSARGHDFGGYNVVNSFETGYRFSSIDGDLGK